MVFRNFFIIPWLAISFVMCSIAYGNEIRHNNILPEGNIGIARKYQGDKGIEKDPNIIFVEKFESGSLEEVFSRWESVKNKNIMSFSSDVPEGSRGGRSLLMTHIGGESTGSHLYRRLDGGYDKVFARFYVKFDHDCTAVHHFGTNLGGNNPSTAWPMVKAGYRPSGDKQFWTGVEPYGDQWGWDFYTYWQGMHIHGDGNYWGTPFLTGGSKPVVDKDKWICVEMMVKINEPVGAGNGEQAFWIDGKLWRRDGQVVSHIGPGHPNGQWTGGWWRPDAKVESTFEGFQWRSDEKLNINFVWLYLYITKAVDGHVSKVWFDDVVVAKEYIGPIEPLRKENHLLSDSFEKPNQRI